MPYEHRIHKYLKDGASSSMNVDGSSTAVNYKLDPPDMERWKIHRLIIQIRDSGNFSAERFGFIASGLTNGILVELCDSDDSVLLDLLDGKPIKANADWGMVCYDVDVKAWGSGDEVLLARWTLAKAGQPLDIQGSKGHYLRVVVQDDLTGLVDMTIMAQGIKY